MPLHVRLISPGKPKLDFIQRGIEEYTSRISHYARIELVWLAVKIPKKNAAPEAILEREAESILKMRNPGTPFIVLDSRGEMMTSEELAAFFQNQMLSHSAVDFVIGGEWGISGKIKKQADKILSISPMTFTHDLTRLILLEQIYRALTILRGEKYHK